MDRVALALQEQGFQITEKHLFIDRFSGFHFQRGQAEFIFRVDDDNETVILALFRRVGPRAGLRQPFAELQWFLEFLSQPPLEIRRIKGLVRALGSPRDGEPPTRRVAECYKRMFGAASLGFDGGEEWVALELKDYQPIRRAMRQGRTS